jgi:hypothetical protein
MSRKHRTSFRRRQDWVDVSRSKSFWYGVAAGFSPEHYLLSWDRRAEKLAQSDSIKYSWTIVGNCLNQALSSYGQEKEYRNERNEKSGR